MDNGILLSGSEVFDITGYQQPACQLRALKQMGVNAKLNARGRVVVSRRHAEQVLGGTQPNNEQQVLPNLDWMDN